MCCFLSPVEPENSTKGMRNPKEGISVIDYITSADEFAKVVDDTFPYSVSILQDEGDFIINFLPEHINEQ